jgi:hypothetical protein
MVRVSSSLSSLSLSSLFSLSLLSLSPLSLFLSLSACVRACVRSWKVRETEVDREKGEKARDGDGERERWGDRDRGEEGKGGG